MPTWVGGAPAETGQWTGATFSSTFAFGGLSTRSAGARWTNVEIPQGAVIDAATLGFTISGLVENGRTVGVHQVDSAPALGNGQRGTDNTPTGSWSGGAGAKSVDLTAGLQALVHRSGWASGGAVTIRWDGTTNDLSDKTLSTATLTVDWHPAFTDYQREVEDLVGVVDAAAVGAGWVRDGADTVTLADAVEQLMPTVRDGADTTAVADAAAATLIEGISRSTGDSVPAADQVAASIVRFEPPPPPWQDALADPEFAEAVLAPHRVSDWRAEIVTPDEVVLTVPLPVEDGQVVVDADRAHRWSCSLAVPDGAWYPRRETDPLHPHSRHTFQLWWRLWLPRSMRWVEIPAGRYHPRVGENSADGDLPPAGFDVTGVSALATIRAYLQPVDVSGMRAHTAIETILSAVAPTLRRDLTPSPYSLPGEYLVGDVHAGDPVADMHSIARSAGMVLYEDRVGVIRLDPHPDATVVADWSQGVVQSISVRPVDLDATVNSLVVSSGSREVDPPVSATVQITDPADPISVTHGVFYPDRLVLDEVTTQAQCAQVGAVEIARRREAVREVDLVVLPQPHIDMLQVIVLDEPELDAVGPHRVTGWSMRMDPTGLQAVLTRGAAGD